MTWAVVRVRKSNSAETNPALTKVHLRLPRKVLDARWRDMGGVVVFVDRERQRIGLKPAGPDDPGALVLQKPHEGGPYYVVAKSVTTVCREVFGIPAGELAGEWDAEAGMYVITNPFPA